MHKHLKAAPFLLLALTGADGAMAASDAAVAQELGKTYALSELCFDFMREKHDWKLDRDLADLLKTTEEEMEESLQYQKDINRGFDAATSDFLNLKKDEKEKSCYNFAHQ